MDQNQWNEQEDRPSDISDIDHSSPYISEQQYQAQEEQSPHIGAIPPPARPRPWRALGVVLCVMLCAALCFGAGMIGARLAGDDPYSPSADAGDAPDFQTPQNNGTNNDANGLTQTDADKASSDPSKRNPDPDVDKKIPLSSVTYSGSAGDKAYSTLAEAYDRVNESVVEITTETVVNGGWLGNYVTGGAGSGVIISKDGYIVTNNHVIDDADQITVRMTDGTTYAAVLIGTDAATDVAVLWIETDQALPAATLGCSSDLVVGEKVFAIGNPLGSLGGTLTDGIISATERQITIDGSPMTLLQTNAAVNPGNSGGGLFNMAGELIGVVNAKYSQDDVEGLGFAIPVDIAYDVIGQLIEYGYVRGVVDSGLTLYDATSAMSAWRNFGATRIGAYIVESQYSEELQFGDYLLNIDGVSITQGADAEALLSSYSVGDTVTIQVIRLVETVKNNQRVSEETMVTVELTLREYVPEDIHVRFDNE